MLAHMAKKSSKKKQADKPLTAAEILARMHEEEANRADRREISERRRKAIKEKQRASALRMWAPGGRLRKMQKDRKKQAENRRKSS